jgi:SAM-dependent methyltransferase
MNEYAIASILEGLAKEYPVELVNRQLADVPRIAFHIHLALKTSKRTAVEALSLCDIGGGIGLFSLGCAALGFRRVLLIDDFSDPINQEVGDGVLDLHRRYGVEVVSRDVVSQGLQGINSNCNVITSFDSMEHWHQSPKKLLRDAIDGLDPTGSVILGVPNCVNLRKRLSVPFGIGKWSSMQEWYESTRFRGHVREPDVADLEYIAKDLRLEDVKILGRNWLGYGSPRVAIRLATRIVDFPLRLRPSLCSNIYLVGRKSTH